LVVVGIVLGFTVFKNNKNNGAKYRTEAISRGDIEALVVSSGTLNPVTVVDVGSQVSGKIDKLYVDFNSKVKQGQLIAELDQSSFITQVNQNEANYQSSVASLERSKVTLENVKKQYERALNLFEKDLISFEEKDTAETQYYTAKSDVQSAEARLQQAKSQLETSKVNLAYTVIRSPIDGVVISRDVNVGQTVAASFQAPVLFKIANDLSKMRVECSVDEADIGKVKEGQISRFTVDAFSDETFSGTVTQVRYSPETVQNVVTYTTIVDVENPELKLRPGMTATVSIVTGEAKNALRVPNAALRFTPQLTAKQMEEIMKEVRDRFMAQRQGSGQPGEKREGSDSSQGPQMTQRQSGQGGMPSAEMMARFSQSGQSAARRRGSQVWIQDEQGKLSMVFLRTGVTDNTYSEILRGDLKEGQLVITGLESATRSSSSSQNPGPPPGMMFIRR
jgi:HlyD family secretion protein